MPGPAVSHEPYSLCSGMNNSDSLSQLGSMCAKQHRTVGLQTESLPPISCLVSMKHFLPLPRPFRAHIFLIQCSGTWATNSFDPQQIHSLLHLFMQTSCTGPN